MVNLKALNDFVETVHFKMEGLHTLRDLLKQGDWLAKVDLKDAYFAIPIRRDHQKFLQFMPCYSTSPTVLLTPANGSDNGSEQQPELRLDGPPVAGMPRGAGLMDSASEQMEWQESGVSVGGHDHRIGRLSDQLGNSLRGCSDERPEVENRGDVAHQLSGVAGGDGSEVLCQEQDGHPGAAQDGQHDSGVVCKPQWRNCVQRISGAH